MPQYSDKMEFLEIKKSIKFLMRKKSMPKIHKKILFDILFQIERKNMKITLSQQKKSHQGD